MNKKKRVSTKTVKQLVEDLRQLHDQAMGNMKVDFVFSSEDPSRTEYEACEILSSEVIGIGYRSFPALDDYDSNLRRLIDTGESLVSLHKAFPLLHTELRRLWAIEETKP